MPFYCIDNGVHLRELALTVFETWCKDIQCPESPDRLSRNVFFSSQDEFMEAVRQDAVRSLTVQEETFFLKKAIEFVSRDSRILYFNSAVLEQSARDISVRQPDLARQIGGRDIFTTYLETILFHAAGHAFRSREVFVLPQPMVVEDENEKLPKITLTKIDGLALSGEREDGTIYFLGDEAMTEHIARIKGSETQVYFHGFIGDYTQAADLIHALNLRAGIPVKEFLTYFIGKKPIAELLQRWGSIEGRSEAVNRGIGAYMVIQMRAHGNITQQVAAQKISQYLGSSALQLYRPFS